MSVICGFSMALQSCFKKCDSVCVSVYLAGHPVWAQLSEAKGGLYSPQQSHHIQVLYSPSANSTPSDYNYSLSNLCK